MFAASPRGMTHFILCTPAEAVPATRADAKSECPFMIDDGRWWLKGDVDVVLMMRSSWSWSA